MSNENARNTVKQFASHFSNMDTKAIADLLVEDGEFYIQDKHGEDVEAESKEAYVRWLGMRFQDFRETFPDKEKIRYNFDKCLGCSLGQQVVFFDEGMFPRYGEYEGGILIHGLMVQTRGEKIWRILFCYNFKYLEKYVD